MGGLEAVNREPVLGKVEAGEERACAGCCQGREEGRDSNVNLEIFWLPCFVASLELVLYTEQGFSAIASKARCGAGRRRLVFSVDGVDRLLFSTENGEIPGPWLLGTR